MAQHTIKTLRQRVERLNEKWGTEFQLNQNNMGYHLLDADHSKLTPKRLTASEMYVFLKGMSEMHHRACNRDDIRDLVMDNIEAENRGSIFLPLSQQDVDRLPGMFQ